MPIDSALVGALHVEYLRRRDLGGDEHLHHTIFQTSTVDALLDGAYDGDVTFSQLAARGDFGLGTFDALDGEMVALDGEFFRVRADGRAYRVQADARTPFAVVTFFEPGAPERISGPLDLAALCARLDRLLDPRAACCSVRLDGTFEYVRTRSVPRQRRPYPPLAEVVKDQPTFELRDVAGTIVGFRFPTQAQGLNVPGYHFHFLTANRSAGGHVLEVTLLEGNLFVDEETEVRLELPPGVDLPRPDPSGARKETLDRIERG